MNFNAFNHTVTEFTEQYRILEECGFAEEYVYTDPHAAITNARSALELLCKDALKRKNVERLGNLSQMIDLCLEKEVFISGASATIIRKRGNDVVHVNLTKNHHIAREENIREAMEAVEALFYVVAETFGVKGKKFDQHEVPFGPYDIVRKVKKAPSEVIVGDWHYFVKSPGGDLFLLQILPRKDADLGARNEDARKILKNQYESRLLRTQNLTISPESDRQYILYDVHENSFLLSEQHRPLTPRQAVQVGIDLIRSLQQMQEDGIHHRNIQPGCVVLTPVKGLFRANLVNMETAKIENFEQTVYGYIRENFPNNPYMPPTLRRCADDSFSDWEKADVYAVAMVMIYCLAPDLVSANTSADDLYNRFSDDMVHEVFRPIFESDLRAIFTLEEFRRMLEERIDGEEDH